MKWGLQHVKVTLEESESGETVVIEQTSDGRVTCERGAGGKRERAANTPPRRAAETKAAPRAEQPVKPTTEHKRGSEDRPKAKAEAEPRARSDAKKPRPERTSGEPKGRRKSLEWEPVKDHDYDGFAAYSDAGRFKVLITKGSQWALFYELKGAWPKNLGCFRKVEMAQKRAQELHDTGWPESEFGPVTAGQIARACPAPTGTDEGEDEETPRPRRKAREKPADQKPAPKAEEKPPAPKPESTSKAEEKPASPTPEPKGSSKTEADKDKELMGSFTRELDTVLDEDEDD